VRPADRRQTAHQVHVLHRLAGRALHQVVDHRKHDDGVAALRPVHGNAAGVGALDAARLRRGAGRHHVDKGLACIGGFIQRLQVAGIALQRGVQRGVNAADHRQQVRHKREADTVCRHAGEALRDFRQMAMTANPVGLERFARFRKERVHFRLAPGAGHTGLGIGHQPRRIDQPSLEQRQEAELHGGGIAAGVADDARVLDGLAIHFRQAVNGLLENLRAAVRHAVPLFESREILETEIRTKVDDLHAARKQGRRLLHGHTMRGGKEHDVAGTQHLVRGLAEGEIDAAAQVGEHLRHRHAGLGARGDGGELHLRVLRQQAQQLDTGISGAANDSDLDTRLAHDCFTYGRGMDKRGRDYPPRCPEGQITLFCSNVTQGFGRLVKSVTGDPLRCSGSRRCM